MTWIIFLFTLCFTFVSWHRFWWSMFFLFLLLPSYLVRFSVGPIPTTFLEIMLLTIVVIFLAKHPKQHIRALLGTNTHLRKTYPLAHYSGATFLLAATVSIFTAPYIFAAAGVWKAFFVEPVLLFFVLYIALKKEDAHKHLKHSILFPLILSGLLTALLAIYQRFTGWMVPWDFWENRNTYRVTGWYGYPNAISLYIAPMIPLAVYLAKDFFSPKRNSHWYTILCAVLFLGAALPTIVFAKSTGALIGILGGAGFLLLLYKKTRWPAILIGIVGIVSVLTIPELSPVRTELLFQDFSGQIRLTMWAETLEFLQNHPILGAGLDGYKTAIAPYHRLVNGVGVEIYHLPHNIFLSMWVNIGIVGLISFLGIIVWFFWHTLGAKKRTLLQTCVAVSMVIILIHGLVDTPYYKNDLAIIFWILLLVALVAGQEKKKALQ